MAHILIVDDEAGIRRALRDVLEFEKYSVDEAGDGLEGLVKIKQKKPDAVLLDVKMPKWTAWKRSTASRRSLPKRRWS